MVGARLRGRLRPQPWFYPPTPQRARECARDKCEMRASVRCQHTWRADLRPAGPGDKRRKGVRFGMLSSFFLFFSRRAELRARGQDDKGCKAALLARLRSAVHAGIPRIAGEGGEERGGAERGGEERRAGKGWNDEADLDEQPAPSHQEGGGGHGADRHGAETVSLPRAGGGHADAVDWAAVDAGGP